jgi:paired amphipathic helix protein Sin3a
LNDALSYLDQVKVQFANEPNVYNNFLDIMKDFKSGQIDTPGVINRVSTLFAGNPDLIQGFNTFLPPGYRIECGAGDDPNTIRVTTPMGTTNFTMPPAPIRGPMVLDVQDRPTNGSYTPQPPPQAAGIMYSPSGRPGAAGQGQGFLPASDVLRQSETAGQPEQRVLNSLQNVVSAASTGMPNRVGMSPHPPPVTVQDSAAGSSLDPQAQGQMGAERRGPVEFNHAISYVNKIKTRFAAHPDIYKQFLEILQTYQRESKPIQDVYTQVTHLFKTAPDLLDDFKQFLPESAAQAKAAERARLAEENLPISNVRGDPVPAYGSPVMSREPHVGTPVHRGGLPPVGNFAPTSVSKDNKRKRADRPDAGATPDGGPVPSTSKVLPPGQSGKRTKTVHAAPKIASEVATSPTLVPALPVPIEPTTTSAATSEELAFFDKAKKVISNKNVMNEFLKLCNLFAQDLIDRSTLMHRARSFLGTSPDLVKWFSDWVGYDERDILVENKPRIPPGRVTLSNCRGLGPSYRLLPKRERQKVCSGRDELCNQVLNDEWASHPTWASEDSGFIAHRKNVHEEGLHRIEEERHDYDYNIEACSRTIQLLEPIATQLRRMDDAAVHKYKLPPNLGGQSEMIYKRVIMKLYGREKGQEVIESLHHRPYQVIPVLLNRLKERLETWKIAQREWEKIWREQTQKMFWKSLDHQAVSLRLSERRQFQTKTLQSEIQVKYEEMKRANNTTPGILRNPQMEFVVEDADVIVDATYLILRHIDEAFSTDHPRLSPFVRDFIALFFGLNAELFRERIDEKLNRSPQNGSIDEAASGGEEVPSAKSHKAPLKNGNLLRTALGRGRKSGRREREESHASGSRATTPEVASNADDEMIVDGQDEAEPVPSANPSRWLDHPTTGNRLGSQDVNPHEPQKRDTYRFWANTTIYCFLRLFITFYERLLKLKLAEASVRETVLNAQRTKPAVELGIMDKMPLDFFEDTGPEADYYSQMLNKLDSCLQGGVEFAEIEDSLRRFYLQSGYTLYGFEKLVATLARTAVQVMNSEAKDKSADIFQAFKRDRSKPLVTAQQQTDYRKAVEKMIKDAELYRIDFVSSRVP